MFAKIMILGARVWPYRRIQYHKGNFIKSFSKTQMLWYVALILFKNLDILNIDHPLHCLDCGPLIIRMSHKGCNVWFRFICVRSSWDMQCSICSICVMTMLSCYKKSLIFYMKISTEKVEILFIQDLFYMYYIIQILCI